MQVLPYVCDLFTHEVGRLSNLRSSTVLVMWKPHGQEGYETSQAAASGHTHTQII